MDLFEFHARRREKGFQMPAPNNGDMSGQMERKLREMKEAWERNKEESKKAGGRGGTTLKPGEKYLTRLSDAMLRDGENGPYARLEFTCIEGDQTGEKGIVNGNFDSDDRIVYFQRDLRRLGVEVDDFDVTQLPAILADLKAKQPGVRLAVAESKDGKYINCYIDKLVQMDEGSPDVGGEDDAVAAPPPPRGAAPRPAPRAAPAPATGRFSAPTPAPAARPAPGPAKPAPRPASAVRSNPAPVEEPAAVEEVEPLEVNQQVGYITKAGVRKTGVVNKLVDDDIVHVKDDADGKLYALKRSVNQISGLIPVEEEAVPEA